MARTPKPLQPLDTAIARILADAIEKSGLTRRVLADQTGMSANRIGIILREEQPPATVGEVGILAEAVGMDASSVIRAAEASLAEEPSPTARVLAFSRPLTEEEIDAMITENPAASDPPEGYDADAEVEAQQDEP
jgi:transcriptional regulator with XRE-family HTH domain